MKEDMGRLLAAQDIDLEIDRLERSRKEYPEQIALLNEEIDNLRRSVAELEAVLVETRETREDVQEERQSEAENLARKEKRLLETKTNKEYNAVQSEIEQARARIDSLETEEIELMSRLDALEPRMEEARNKLEETAAANTARIAELEGNLGSLETDIEERRRKRDALLETINKRLLAMYTRLRKGRNGIAVARVGMSKFSCTGCYKRLPPQRIVELRRGNALINCENCGRILVWDDQDGE
jgi:predicted  nucleic acid-binding Zn-ribbon protein